ncbi:MAG: HAD family phosphatase [Bacteroidales bacterium]|nr:HAD family phosphatase [Bacteroidales bacterium]MBR6930864.1 HAD family phosphatase [Bacteroidales bacterium]
MSAKIKNIIFDLGGVVLDIDESIVYKELEKMGINTSELAHSKDLMEILSKFDTGIYTAPTFRKKMKALIGQEKMTDQKFDSIWDAMLLDIPRERIEAIEKVKKHYKIFLMSNSNVIHYDLYVRDLQLRFGYNEFDELFNKSYFSFAEHLEKPDPRFFELILDHEGLLPEETLFIDDTAANIKVAQSLGINTYHISREELVRNLFVNGVLKDGVI